FGAVFKIDGIVKVRNLKAATKLFLNGDVSENHAYIRNITSSTTSMHLLAKQAVYLSPERFFVNSGCTHQLNQITKVCQVQSCILLATVTDISNEANFKCVAPRYRVKVTVFDEHTKTSTILILFDHEVTQIIGKSAYSLYDLFVDNRDKIPHELYDMVGKQWLFRLPKHQDNTYADVPKIVSRISDDPALISVFNDIVASHSVSVLI
ncbi:replication protein A 70 kDa DNA-binding subunit C-like protein, partial [Tanacetum coccineum]